jgi:hypothetical protein
MELAFCEEISSTVKTHGLAVAQDVIPREILDELVQQANDWRVRICGELSRRGLEWNNPTTTTTTPGGGESTNPIRFWEVASRCKGRMDVRQHDTDEKSTTNNNNNNPKPTTPFWQESSLLGGIGGTLLHGGEPEAHEPRLVYAGWIFSFLGSDDHA